MGLCNNFMIEKITQNLGPVKESHLLVNISPLSCPVLQYGLEVHFGNAVVLYIIRMGSFHQVFQFWKVTRSGIWQMGWLLHNCDLHLDKNCFTDTVLNEKECCGEDPCLLGHSASLTWHFFLNASEYLHRITGWRFAQLEGVCGVWYLQYWKTTFYLRRYFKKFLHFFVCRVLVSVRLLRVGSIVHHILIVWPWLWLVPILSVWVAIER